MSRWTGRRLELACGHYSLEDGHEPRDIGQKTACWICPRVLEGNRQDAAVRHIVSVVMVSADHEPEHIEQGL